MSDANNIRQEISSEIRRLTELQTRANKRWLMREPGAFWAAQLFAAIIDATAHTIQAGSDEDIKAALAFIRGLR